MSPTCDSGLSAGGTRVRRNASTAARVDWGAESGLRRQVADVVLNRIETFGIPKSLTVAKEIPGTSKGRVAHFAFCVRRRLFVSYAGGRNREVIDATLTFFFTDMDLDDGPRYVRISMCTAKPSRVPDDLRVFRDVASAALGV